MGRPLIGVPRGGLPEELTADLLKLAFFTGLAGVLPIGSPHVDPPEYVCMTVPAKSSGA